MRVRALLSFVDETGRHEAGDVFELSDSMAAIRIREHQVQRVPEEVRTATLPEPELAVTRRGKR